MADTYTELKEKCLEVVKRIENDFPEQLWGMELWHGYRVIDEKGGVKRGILYAPPRTQGAAPIPAKQECASVQTMLWLARDIAAGLEGFIRCDSKKQQDEAASLLDKISKAS